MLLQIADGSVADAVAAVLIAADDAEIHGVDGAVGAGPVHRDHDGAVDVGDRAGVGGGEHERAVDDAAGAGPDGGQHEHHRAGERDLAGPVLIGWWRWRWWMTPEFFNVIETKLLARGGQRTPSRPR